MNEMHPSDTDFGPRPDAAGAPASGQPEKFERLREVLREMFQLDRGDLDFGLYRIMNLKRVEVERFLGEDLLPQARTLLGLSVRKDLEEVKKELAEKEAIARELGVLPSDAPEVRRLRAEIEGLSPEDLDEGDVYKHLASFFERYYKDGDFAAQRRYSSAGHASYLIPYDGEEVKLHWANADQYYIKTTENYASYVFRVADGAEADRRARFETAAAVGTRDNAKEANGRTRCFVLASGRDAVTADGGNLVVRFEHRPLTTAEKRQFPGNGNAQQAKINEDAANRIRRGAPAEWQAALARPEPTESSPERTTLDRHIAAYTAKNSFDYFIHKDLGGFLRRELDLYLKTEVLNLDDLEPGNAAGVRRAIARMRAIRTLGEKIIAFLAQLEDFQKRLWLKRKFVLETQYCVTLDRVPESLYAEITGNEAQRAEWESLYAISEIPPSLMNGGGGASATLTEGFLRVNPYLVLDTRHFHSDFKGRLLGALSESGPLHEAQDGLLIHGENFQAIRLLDALYRRSVQCIYADPPYNTDSSSILYKNDLKNSSWLSLMEDRLRLAKRLLSKDGIVCCAIDDEEAWRLRALLQSVFEKEIGVAPVRSTPIGRTSVGKLSPTHEYALFYGGASATPGPLVKTDKEKQRYPFFDDRGRYAWRNLVRTGTNDKRADRPKLYYAIFVRDDDTLRVPRMEWDEERAEYRLLEQPGENEIIVWPVKEQNGQRIEKNWERGWERVAREASEYRVQRSDDGAVSIHFVQRMDVSSVPKTWWGDSKYASSNHGAKVLKDLFVENPFDFPKAVPLVEDCIRAAGGGEKGARVLDFFAGSGTTGHAVVNLNRVDAGQRRYVLVEMGDHFDGVLLPRIKKVVYSPDWKDGKPISRRGISQFLRYLRIESYEDTMDSLTLVSRDDGSLGLHPDVIEDYRLRYALSLETTESACLLGSEFEDPFGYTLSVVRDGERRETPVDLPETFNLLLGLREASRRRLSGVLAIEGEDAEGSRCLILWRNRRETDNRALDAWFSAHRKEFDPFDRVYANGDHTLNAVAHEEDSWIAMPIEPTFRRLMFEDD